MENHIFWCDEINFVFVNLPAASAQDLVRLSALVGSRVAVIGLCVPYDHSPRVVTGKLFKAASVDSISRLEQPPESSDADLPLIQEIRDARPAALADLGRHRAQGRVLATWMGNMALLRTDNGAIVGVEFVPGTRLPAVGDVIEAVADSTRTPLSIPRTFASSAAARPAASPARMRAPSGAASGMLRRYGRPFSSAA